MCKGSERDLRRRGARFGWALRMRAWSCLSWVVGRGDWRRREAMRFSIFGGGLNGKLSAGDGFGCGGSYCKFKSVVRGLVAVGNF